MDVGSLQAIFDAGPVRVLVATVLAPLISILSTATGVGGGGFFVPLFNLLLNFDVEDAGALSAAVIAGGSLAGVGVALLARHPDFCDQPLIDFELALILLPVVLLGVSVGMLGKEAFPAWLLTLLLIILLGFLSWKMMQKALQLHAGEEAQQAEQCGGQSPKAGQVLPVIDWGESFSVAETVATCPKPSAKKPRSRSCPPFARGKPPSGCSKALPKRHSFEVLEVAAMAQSSALRLSATCSEDSNAVVPVCCGMGRMPGCLKHAWEHACLAVEGLQLARMQITLLLACWLLFLALEVLRRHWSPCKFGHWVLFGVITVSMLAAEALLIKVVHQRMQDKKCDIEGGGHQQHAQNFALLQTVPQLMYVAAITLGSGILAGLLGVSGGMLLVPLLLEFGMVPQVASATSLLIVLFSTSSAAVSFGVAGELDVQFALLFGSLCLGASVIGMLFIGRYVARTGRASLLVFLLAILIMAATVLEIAFAGRSAVADLMHHRHVGFHSLCIRKA